MRYGVTSVSGGSGGVVVLFSLSERLRIIKEIWNDFFLSHFHLECIIADIVFLSWFLIFILRRLKQAHSSSFTCYWCHVCLWVWVTREISAEVSSDCGLSFSTWMGNTVILVPSVHIPGSGLLPPPTQAWPSLLFGLDRLLAKLTVNSHDACLALRRFRFVKHC